MSNRRASVGSGFLSGMRPTYYGWRVAAVCVAVTAFRAGAGVHTLGFLVGPLRDELGWSATIVTAGITARALVAALLGPLVGMLLDRIGGRWIIAVGMLLDGLSLLLVSQATQLWQFMLAMVVLGGLSEACIGSALVLPFIAKWFVARRGLAVGMVVTGTNMGAALVAPLVVLVTAAYGWRVAWAAVGLIPILLVMPLVLWVLRSTPEAMGLQPDGVTSAASGSTVSEDGSPEAEEADVTLRQALAMPTFWLLLVAWNLVDFAGKGAMVNKIPYALEMGFQPADAAGIIAVFGVTAIIGKLVFGYLSDRIDLRLVGAGLAAIQALGLFVFVDSDSTLRIYLAYGVLTGFSAGGLIALMPLTLARCFGRRHLGAISGAAAFFLIVSSFGGPMTAAMISDYTGSYVDGFRIFAASSALAAIALLFLKTPSSQMRRAMRADRCSGR